MFPEPVQDKISYPLRDMKGAKDLVGAVPPLMEEIGVIGNPEIWFAEGIEPLTYS